MTKRERILEMALDEAVEDVSKYRDCVFKGDYIKKAEKKLQDIGFLIDKQKCQLITLIEGMQAVTGRTYSEIQFKKYNKTKYILFYWDSIDPNGIHMIHQDVIEKSLSFMDYGLRYDVIYKIKDLIAGYGDEIN